MSRIFNMLARRWSERHRYARTRDWMFNLYDRAVRRPFGRKWLPGRGKSVVAYLKDDPQPFHIRLGTSDWLVLDEIFMRGEYASLSRVELGDVNQIVDLGANVGYSVRYWNKLFPSATVLAVEPDPDNLAAIEKNCPKNSKTIIVKACVAGSARKVQIDRSLGAWGVRMVEHANGPNCIESQALSLPGILSQHNIEGTIDLMKCDIEGAEEELFQNCGEWIGRVRTLLIEIHSPYTVDQWTRDVRNGGAELRIAWSSGLVGHVTVLLAQITPAVVGAAV